MRLTKSDFITFLMCPKSLWLQTWKPNVYPHGEISDFVKRLAREGYDLEDKVRQLVMTWTDKDAYSFQDVFEAPDGIFARADMVRHDADGSVDIFEIKSSSRVKTTAPQHHLKDAAFQRIAASRAGFDVGRSVIVHVNSSYVRDGELDLQQLFTFADETTSVLGILIETEAEIDDALSLLKQTAIDESSCSCLYKSRAQHCDSFDYFNPAIPVPSIFSLPRISGRKLEKFVSEKRFALDDIELEEVSKQQKPVLLAHKEGTPYVDLADIEKFLSALTFPLYFLDYEAIAAAVPMVDGISPHTQLPFQFSLHILTQDGVLEHAEYLAETPELPTGLVEALERWIGPTGSIVVWNKTFENSRNKEMAAWFPDKATFLHGLIERTVDLMEVFKTGYVDIAFEGSTSIKKVLPVIAPALSYDDLAVSDGTAAMDAFMAMTEASGEEHQRLKSSLLAYCELDTLAMVRIFQFVEAQRTN